MEQAVSARAPEAIYRLWDDIHKLVPRAVLSGIVGDVAHSFGYHLSRHDLPASDYSVQLPADRRGKPDCASALDVSMPPDLMKTVTRRLRDAARAKDPRLKALREFCGTLDGANTYPWQLQPDNGSEGIGSWDSSHLWHVHLSFLRVYADDYAALAPIAEVFAGIPARGTSGNPSTPTVQEDAMVKILRVDRKDATKHGVRWPGDFEFRGDGSLVHIPTVARLTVLRAIGCPVQTITVDQYRALGGK